MGLISWKRGGGGGGCSGWWGGGGGGGGGGYKQRCRLNMSSIPIFRTSKENRNCFVELEVRKLKAALNHTCFTIYGIVL